MEITSVLLVECDIVIVQSNMQIPREKNKNKNKNFICIILYLKNINFPVPWVGHLPCTCLTQIQSQIVPGVIFEYRSRSNP